MSQSESARTEAELEWSSRSTDAIKLCLPTRAARLKEKVALLDRDLVGKAPPTLSS